MNRWAEAKLARQLEQERQDRVALKEAAAQERQRAEETRRREPTEGVGWPE